MTIDSNDVSAVSDGVLTDADRLGQRLKLGAQLPPKMELQPLEMDEEVRTKISLTSMNYRHRRPPPAHASIEALPFVGMFDASRYAMRRFCPPAVSMRYCALLSGTPQRS